MVPLLSVLLACAGADEPAPVAPSAPTMTTPSADRVVAVGDLHADLDNALATLEFAGVIDAAGRWAAGTATFVQTGDTTDRGPDSKAIIDVLRRLGPEAEAAGGRVVALLGNHEVMNMVGDWRYVHPGDIEQFGGAEARKAALAPDGAYGRWLLERDIVAKVGDTIFVHGGVTPAMAARGLDTLNRDARAAIRAGNPGAEVLGSDGPLWFRGYVQDPETVACPALAEALGTLGATRMVVGHTTQRSGKVLARCGGRLTVIDIGIADHYGAHLGAWELSGGDAKALYPTGPVDLPDPPS